MIRNLLALIGLLTVAGIGYAGYLMYPYLNEIRQINPEAMNTYRDLAEQVVRSGTVPDATVWRVQAQADVTPPEIEQSLRAVAAEHDMQVLGELAFNEQIEATLGVPYRYAKTYFFCNPDTIAKLLDFSDAFSAYLPCGVSIVEDKTGVLWLYTLNLDLLVRGGRQLPGEVEQEVNTVKQALLDIMARASRAEL